MREPGAPGPRVGVLDYGSGNLHSAVKALQAAGAEVVLGGVDAVGDADGLVVPGVGAFAACMDGLVAAGGDVLVRERLDAGRPVLGICVGHQVMFEAGIEHGARREGIGVLPGVVARVPATRVPHMGWNTVEAAPGSTVLADERYYFVHSYGVLEPLAAPDARTAWATHEGVRVVAGVEHGTLTTCQFHPEKSGEAGVSLLARWVDTLR